MCVEQPILAAIDWQAVQREESSLSWSSIKLTARSRTSGENVFVVLRVVAPSYLEAGASD